MITLVSLGLSCQTTHQLARYTEEYPVRAQFAKSPFDWLICPPDNATDWIEHDLCEFNPEDIIDYRGRAYWPRFGFWFWHGFITIDGDNRTLDIVGNADQEISKFIYQRNSFRHLDPGNTIFCISNTQNNLITEVFDHAEINRCFFSQESIGRLQDALDRFFGRPVQLKVITRKDRTSSSLIKQDNVFVLPADKSEWKGNRRNWDKMLDRLLGHQ